MQGAVQDRVKQIIFLILVRAKVAQEAEVILRVVQAQQILVEAEQVQEAELTVELVVQES